MNVEVLLKTLAARGRLNYALEKELNFNDSVSKALGCWIINLNYKIVYLDDGMYLKGSYSMQLWYSKDNDTSTQVYEELIPFESKVDLVNLSKDYSLSDLETKIFVNKYPTAIKMDVANPHLVKIAIEGLFFIDIFKESVVTLNIDPTLKPDLTMDEELLLNVNPNYLIEKDHK